MSGEKTPRAIEARAMQELLRALGKRICSRRAEKGFSQEDFAEACDLHRTEMGLLERGKSTPRLDTLLSLAEGLGISVSELLQGLSRGQKTKA
jgi:transcriptional regulator with XRE-family HTH domain